MQQCKTVPQRLQRCLAVQLQADPGQVLPNPHQAMLKISLVRMNQDKVVHITDVIADLQLFFDHVVHVVQYGQGYQLTDLTAEAYAALAVALYDPAYMLRSFPVTDPLPDCLDGHIVPDAFKKVMYIAFQHSAVRPIWQWRIPSFPSAVPPVALQMARHPVQTVQHAAPALACAVVGYE